MRILPDNSRKLVQRQLRQEGNNNRIHTGDKQVEKQTNYFNKTRRESAYQVNLRILLVVSGRPALALEEEISTGRRPDIDNNAIQKALGADMLTLSDVETTNSGRLITRFLGPQLALAWIAFCRSHTYDIVYTTTETVGLPLALLFKLRWASVHPRHVALSHYLSPLKKRIFFTLGAGNHIDTLIVHCAAQHYLITKVLRFPEERVIKLPYFVDTGFWHPIALPISEKRGKNEKQLPMICAVGLEFRDHATFVTAVADLNVEVRIAAAGNFTASAKSPYGTARMPADLSHLPSNVLIRSYTYRELRELYMQVQFVVVPLCERDAPAGVTAILEAMAMGKAVIVSGTRGQTDVVRDPRNNGRGPVIRQWWPGFLEEDPDVAETLGSLPTGLYVTPGDPDELREAIQYLLDHPDVAGELGRNGQLVARSFFNLDAFVRRFSAAILGDSCGSQEYLP